MRKPMDGFTLIELVIVILIIGVISITVMPKWTASSLGLEFEARRVLNDIRYAQALSITSGQRYRWVQLSANVYQITNQAGTAIILPNGGTQLTLSNGVSFGALTNLPNSLIAFNSQGVPYTTSTTPGTALAATASIPLTLNGVTRTVQINQQTGYGVLA
jgi:prepilin-type N-terminal cleavage/methylation domain-containing protein